MARFSGRGVREGEQMTPLDVIEPQRVAQGMQYLFGWLPGASLFQTGVVLGANPGQLCDFTAPQAGDTATGAELDRHADLLRCESGAADPKKVAQIVVVHALSLICTGAASNDLAGPGST